MKEVIYLGHKISKEGVSPDPAKVDAILQWNGGRAPSNVPEVRSFVSTAGYYQRFIPRYAIITAPLTRLLHKDVLWQWGEEEQNAFETVKEKLVSAPVLSIPDFTRSFILQTDACDYGISAILAQEGDEGEIHPLAFKSRKLIPAETRYPTHEKEALAMVWGVQKFRAYLQGVPFVAYTDNSAVTWLMNSNHTGKLARWALSLQEYDFTIKHVRGESNPADGPSRAPAVEPSATSEILPRGHDVLQIEQTAQPELLASVTSGTSRRSDISVNEKVYSVSSVNGKDVVEIDTDAMLSEQNGKETFGAQNWVMQQKRDPVLRVLYELAATGSVRDEKRHAEPTKKEVEAKARRKAYLAKDMPKPGEGMRHLKRAKDLFQGFSKRYRKTEAWVDKIGKKLFIDNDKILKYRHELPDGRVQVRIMVPKSMILPVLYRYHNDSRTGAHLGRDKMIANITPLFFWNRMTRDVREFVKTCEACQSRKPAQPLRQGKIRIIDQEHLEAEPMVIVSIDTVGPLPTSARGNVYILVMACHTTKWKMVTPIPDKTAHTVAWALYRNLVRPFTVPKILISDQGTEFVAEVTQKLAELLQIDHRASTAGHHQTVTGSENFTKWLKNTITMYIDQNHSDWDGDYLQEVVMCYNKVKHPTTGESPFYLLFGFENREVPEIRTGDADLMKDLKRLRIEGLAALQKIRQDVRVKLLAEGLKRKAIADKDRYDVIFAVGEWVWLWSPKQSRDQKAKKLMPTWTGPWEVIQACPDRRNLEGNALNYRLRARFSQPPRIRMNQTEYIAHVDRLRLYSGVKQLADLAPPNSMMIFNDTESYRSSEVDSEPSRIGDEGSAFTLSADTEPSRREVMSASSGILWDRRKPLERRVEEVASSSSSEVIDGAFSSVTRLRRDDITREILTGILRFHLENRHLQSVEEDVLLDDLRIVGPERITAHRVIRCLCLVRLPDHVAICSIWHRNGGKAYVGLMPRLREEILQKISSTTRVSRGLVHDVYGTHVEPLLERRK
jgi:hypothetical protein